MNQADGLNLGLLMNMDLIADSWNIFIYWRALYNVHLFPAYDGFENNIQTLKEF